MFGFSGSRTRLQIKMFNDDNHHHVIPNFLHVLRLVYSARPRTCAGRVEGGDDSDDVNGVKGFMVTKLFSINYIRKLLRIIRCYIHGVINGR